MPERAARVLVVDSEPKVLATVSSLLRQEGYQVATAEALAPALRDRAGDPPDVLLTELAEVRKQVAAAGAVVRRLQDLCQKGGPPRRPADLNRAVRAALAAEPALAARVTFEPQAGLPPVQGAPPDLERLAGALLRGAGAATVRTGQGPGAVVWLQVEDAGADPDADLLPRLFEPFVAARPGDDGVSLALAKSIARRIGGNVRGDRRAGGGMVFVAELRPAEEGSA